MTIKDIRKYSRLRKQVYNIHEYLSHVNNSNMGNKDIEVLFHLEIDIEGDRLSLDEVKVVYNVDVSKGEVVDYLVVKELKVLTEDLPVSFRVTDSSYEGHWDSYNDCYDDGDLLEEEWVNYWDEDAVENLLIRDIRLGMDGYRQLYIDLHARNLPTRSYITVNANASNIKVTLDETDRGLINPENAYLEKKELVYILKDLLGWDKGNKDMVNAIEIKPVSVKENIDDVLNEFKKNITVMMTHEKFNNLIRDYTVVESDECYLYINSHRKQATLHRYLKGIHFNANTVYDLPLTLSAQYELEDKGSVVSTAPSKWASDTLNGRLQRELHEEYDYHKFAQFVTQHFPSLKGENGDLKQFEMEVRLGDVKPVKTAKTPQNSTYTVVGRDRDKEGSPEKLLATVSMSSYSGNKNQTSECVDAFYQEYVRFLAWLVKSATN